MNRTLLVCLVFSTSCTEPSAPQCREGQHLSGKHCCPKSEEWVPARSRCMNLEPKAPTPPPPVAKAPASQPFRGHCEGTWVGKIKNNEGDRGKVVATIEALKPGTINRPHSKTCGQVKESWSEGHCRLRLVRCSQNGSLLIAAASPSDGSTCEAPTSVVIQCDKKETVTYRRNEDGLRTNGKLDPLAAD